jgi:ribosomal protein S15P/S13E
MLEIARRNGVTVTQAEEIWNSFGATIAKHISSNHRDENNKFNLDKFPVINIQHFGKFIPRKKKINYANYCIDKNQSYDTENNTTDGSVS